MSRGKKLLKTWLILIVSYPIKGVSAYISLNQISLSRFSASVFLRDFVKHHLSKINRHKNYCVRFKGNFENGHFSMTPLMLFCTILAGVLRLVKKCLSETRGHIWRIAHGKKQSGLWGKRLRSLNYFDQRLQREGGGG